MRETDKSWFERRKPDSELQPFQSSARGPADVKGVMPTPVTNGDRHFDRVINQLDATKVQDSLTDLENVMSEAHQTLTDFKAGRQSFNQ